MAVPGFVKGLHHMWRIYGKLPWVLLLQPAIDLATNGFPISGSMYWAAVSRKQVLDEDLGLRLECVITIIQ